MSYRLESGVPVWGNTDDNTILQAVNCTRFFDAVSLCADNHLGYGVPIGGVVASESCISPTAVGYDIACGNCAIKLDLHAKTIRNRVPKIMDDIWKTISFGMGLSNGEKVDHELFDDDLWKSRPAKPLKQLARNQLGTVGSGNHFVDVFEDEEGMVWIGVHFGSRGFGHKIATYFLEQGGAKTDGMNADPLLVPVHSPLGEDYIAHMELAGRYAYAGREWVVERVRQILHAKEIDRVHNHHNYAWREKNADGRDIWVMRKGSTPLYPGQLGFVGGSMGDNSVILEGVESEEGNLNFHSTVHGAGRVMSRNQARGKVDRKTGEVKSVGLISHEMMKTWLDDKGVELRGADTDEAPQAYKRLDEVLAFHAGSTHILHTLTPLGVAMAGKDVTDPYKD